jgi:hypothetical protein
MIVFAVESFRQPESLSFPLLCFIADLFLNMPLVIDAGPDWLNSALFAGYSPAAGVLGKVIDFSWISKKMTGWGEVLLDRW